LLSGFHRAVKLHARGVVFDTSCDSVRATVGSVSVHVETTEELLILDEIYSDGIYNFDLSGPLLIVDIGMNAAYAALYFAAMHPEAVIFAYEPFAPTFRCAETNIALNPILRPQIRTFQYGLSDVDRTMDIEYMDRFRGSVGVYGVPAGCRKSGEVRMERCEFRDAGVELGTLCGEYPDRRVVLKVDCEGSEYAVLGRLADSGMLDRIDLLMIECHRRAHEHDPAALRASLTAHGFGCVHLDPDAPDISMLYAVRAMGASHISPEAALARGVAEAAEK
jgi:FkbM family methyltransferase